MSAVVSRAKLAATLAMMANEHDGVCLTAARTAERLRKEAGFSWEELLLLPPDWQTMLAVCRVRPDRLSAWEKEFCEVLSGYTRPPSDKQCLILEKLYAKAAA